MAAKVQRRDYLVGEDREVLWWTLFKLGSENPESRKKSLRQLAGYTDWNLPKVLSAVAERLFDSDSSVANEAGAAFVQLLSRPGEPSAPVRQTVLPALGKRLEWHQDNRHLIPVECLAAVLRQPNVEEAFLRLLGDELCNRQFREADGILRVLVKSGGAALLDRVLSFIEYVAVLRDDPEARMHNRFVGALWLFVGANRKEATPRLLAVMEGSGKENVRSRIAEQLPEIDSDVASQALFARLLDSSPNVAETAARMLKAIKVQPANQHERLLLATANGDWPTLRQCGAEASELVASILSRQDREQWLQALDFLGEFGDDRAVLAIRSFIDDLSIYTKGIPPTFLVASTNPQGILEPLRPIRAELGTRYERLQHLDSFFCVRMTGVLNGEPLAQLMVTLLKVFVDLFVHASLALKRIQDRTEDPAVRLACEDGCLQASLAMSLMGGNQGVVMVQNTARPSAGA